MPIVLPAPFAVSRTFSAAAEIVSRAPFDEPLERDPLCALPRVRLLDGDLPLEPCEDFDSARPRVRLDALLPAEERLLLDAFEAGLAERDRACAAAEEERGPLPSPPLPAARDEPLARAEDGLLLLFRADLRDVAPDLFCVAVAIFGPPTARRLLLSFTSGLTRWLCLQTSRLGRPRRAQEHVRLRARGARKLILQARGSTPHERGSNDHEGRYEVKTAALSFGRAAAERISGHRPSAMRALAAATLTGGATATLTYRLLRSKED
jgi:hypothetical protein